MNPRPNFLGTSAGALVGHAGRGYRIDAMLDHATVLVQDLETGAWDHLAVSELRPWNEGQEPPPPVPDLVANEAEYAIAQRRFETIRPLLENPYRTEPEVAARAAAVGVNRSTIYAWLRTYQDSPQLSSLIPRKRGTPKGITTLEARREEIIRAAIDTTHRTKQRNRVATTVERVVELCRAAKITAPHANTVRARIAALPRAQTLRERGQGELARNTLSPLRGSFPGADRPLSVVQIDHSKGDIELVDDETRLPIGRPWVTVALDVKTRMVVGIIVSLEAPSAFAAGRCMTQLMLVKSAFLARLGVTGDWPVWGRPALVHMDNAREFRGHLLERAFLQYDIKLQLRPIATPHYGGHIERYMGTISNETRKLPGATFSSPEERKGYDSAAYSAMTLDEFERHIVDWIVNVYHNSKHSALGMSPLAMWRRCIVGVQGEPGSGIQEPPADPERLELDFLPSHECTVQRYGILLDHMKYWDDVLRFRINERDPIHAKLKRKFTVRRDPRDITRVWFLDPDTGIYHKIATRELSRPPVSLWEWSVVTKHLDEQGSSDSDEDARFEALARLRERTAASVLKTKSARRARQRAVSAEKAAKARDATHGAPATAITIEPETGTSRTVAPEAVRPGARPALVDMATLFSTEEVEAFDVDPGLD